LKGIDKIVGAEFNRGAPSYLSRRICRLL